MTTDISESIWCYPVYHIQNVRSKIPKTYISEIPYNNTSEFPPTNFFSMITHMISLNLTKKQILSVIQPLLPRKKRVILSFEQLIDKFHYSQSDWSNEIKPIVVIDKIRRAPKPVSDDNNIILKVEY